MCASDEARIARYILSYLLAHRLAEDTIEGIVEWWLLEESIKRRTRDVQTVLDRLVARNLILVRKSKDAKAHYAINDHKIGEIQAVIDSE